MKPLHSRSGVLSNFTGSSSLPGRVLDSLGTFDDFYLKSLSLRFNNIVTVALVESTYLHDAEIKPVMHVGNAPGGRREFQQRTLAGAGDENYQRH